MNELQGLSVSGSLCWPFWKSSGPSNEIVLELQGYGLMVLRLIISLKAIKGILSYTLFVTGSTTPSRTPATHTE